MTGFRNTTVLPVAFAVCGGVFEQTPLWTDVAVECEIVSETVFAICAVRVGVPTISQNGLIVAAIELARDRCVVVACVETPIERELAQSLVYLL